MVAGDQLCNKPNTGGGGAAAPHDDQENNDSTGAKIREVAGGLGGGARHPLHGDRTSDDSIRGKKVKSSRQPTMMI